MKKRVGQLLFIASFLPYLWILIYGIDAMSSGIPTALFASTKYYGREAFFDSIGWGFVIFCYFIPIIPACIVFQILYILRKKVKKFKEIDLKKYIFICCLIEVLVVVITPKILWSLYVR